MTLSDARAGALETSKRARSKIHVIMDETTYDCFVLDAPLRGVVSSFLKGEEIALSESQYDYASQVYPKTKLRHL